MVGAFAASSEGGVDSAARGWSTSDWVLLGALPTVTVGCTFLDDGVRSFAQEHRNAASEPVATVFNLVGDGRVTIPVVGLLWWGGAAKAPRLARASRNALEAWTLTQVVVQAGKYTVGRARPFRDQGPLDFSGVVLTDDSRHSFPSGHTATAWGLLPAYALEYGDHPWIAGALWGVAAAVGASRIHDDQHWLSDAVFSAGTGYLSNRAVRAWNASSDRAVQVIALPVSDGWLASASIPF